jgi:hypothetical protein
MLGGGGGGGWEEGTVHFLAVLELCQEIIYLEEYL